MTGSPDPDPTLEDLCAYLDANGVSKTRWLERPDVVVAMPLTATLKIVKGKLIARSRPEYRILQAHRHPDAVLAARVVHERDGVAEPDGLARETPTDLNARCRCPARNDIDPSRRPIDFLRGTRCRNRQVCIEYR